VTRRETLVFEPGNERAALSFDHGDLAPLAPILAERSDGIGALVHTVGVFRSCALLDENPDGFSQMFDVNALAAVRAMQSVLPFMRRGGRVVVLSSAAALRGERGLAAYSASKAALARIVESAAEELRDREVGVNAILPTTIDTPENRRLAPEADRSRWVSPQALAELCAFLASPASRALNGASLVAGG
jgi:NAD(P)-dependent dehydrogenase (short-subunit alcohol dehydrogenase family)